MLFISYRDGTAVQFTVDADFSLNGLTFQPDEYGDKGAYWKLEGLGDLYINGADVRSAYLVDEAVWVREESEAERETAADWPVREE